VAATVSPAGARWTSPTFRAGTVTWSLHSNDAELVREVTDLYRACRLDDERAPDFSYIVVTDDATGTANLFRGETLVRERVTRELATAHLVWAVNGEVVAHAGDQLLLHAAAISVDGAGVVVSGAEGTGKSKLTAALVRLGCAYLTDEIVAVDVETGTITPYPKPIVLERGSWPLFEDLHPPAPNAAGADDQWLVAPHHLGPGLVASAPARPRLIVFPTYAPGAPNVPEAIARAEAAIALCTQSFNFRARSPGALDVVARLARACACYTLPYDDATVAASAVRALTTEHSE
jgi:hypothetical protein